MGDVVIVGAGPTGLMAACELALAGVECKIVEQRAEQPNITRAFGLHARALELLDARGMADDIVARGIPMQQLRPAWASTIDLTELDTRYPMLLVVPQSGTEHVLEHRARALGVEIVTGARVVDLAQTDDRVHVTLADGDVLTSEYVIGADGAHSTVRDLLEVGFVGERYELPMILADVRIPDSIDAPPINQTGNDGVVVALPFGDGWFRVGAWLLDPPEHNTDQAPDIAEIRDAFQRIAGTDYQMSDPRWISRFVAERRQARTYRVGRVFLAGDAAHVNSPMGGQGMNTGIQDAINLGWKIAGELQGWAPPSLLDTYQDERHPVGARVLHMTDRLTKLVQARSPVRRTLSRRLMGGMLRIAPARRRFLGQYTGLDIAYPSTSPGSHRLAGRRAPDWKTDHGRLYEVLRQGRFVLCHSGAAPRTVAQPWSDRVRQVHGTDSTTSTTALVRPDGYVAWASEGVVTATELRSALEAWCGPGELRLESSADNAAS